MKRGVRSVSNFLLKYSPNSFVFVLFGVRSFTENHPDCLFILFLYALIDSHVINPVTVVLSAKVLDKQTGMQS